MEPGEYLKVLSGFVTGELTIGEFSRFVHERLLDLRQSAGMTEEKGLLSSIELYLHEAEEGHRSQFDVFILAQSILEGILESKWTVQADSEPKYLPATPLLGLSQVEGAFGEQTSRERFKVLSPS